MKTHVFVVSLVLGLLSAPAFAGDDARVVREPDQTAYKTRTIVSFSDLAISGELVKPSGTLVHARSRRAKFRSLIRFRGDFRPELLRSVDAL